MFATATKTNSTAEPEAKLSVAKTTPQQPNPTWQALATRQLIQTKLAVSQPDDPYEREADRVADQVMRMPAPSAHPNGPGLSYSSVNPVKIRRKCAPCEDEEKKVERKEDGSRTNPPDTAASVVRETLAFRGRPLEPQTRAFMEARFGQDFSEVRVHTGERAAESAAAVNALAFTVGRNVVFSRGQYEPASQRGRQLIAHELAHVAQGTPPDQVRRYRAVKKSEKAMKNYGAVDDPKAGLVEKAAPEKGDPVIETIHVTFDGNAKDLLNPGELLVTGTLTAKYRASDKRPDIVIPVSGGTSADRPFGLTDRIKSGMEVHKVQGPGYSDKAVTGKTAQPAPKGEFSHYVKQTKAATGLSFGFESGMGLAVYFKGTQAVHLGDLTFGSHACVHVDWVKNKNEMRLINYHSLIGFTKVTIEYVKNAAFKAVCCAPSRVKRGFVNPCDVFSAADCQSAPAKKP